MNLKLRFALLFTTFVAIILLISTATIYFLYASYREEDYYTRALFEGEEVFRLYKDISTTSSRVSADQLRTVHDKALFKEQVFILDTTGAVIFQMPDSVKLSLPFASIKEKTLKTGQYNYIDDEDILHLYLYKPSEHSFIGVSGYDRIGYKKLRTLEIILAAVFLGGLLLTAIMSFLFVNEAVKPIVKLSSQMQRTNEMNLSNRIDVKPAKDELYAIAHNFNAMLERLRKAFESQKSFVHHASHELRTPLAVMLSQTEAALNRPYSAEEYKNILKSLKEDQQHMVELTNSLLLISQYQTFEFMAEWPYLRIDELLYETISIAKRMYADIEIDIKFSNIPIDDLALLVKGNDSLLRSAFMNLIKNAYTYSIDKKVMITIECSKQYVTIAVENKGPQLTQAEIEQMSIPFFRGENAINKRGFGLGLSIVERILTIHKGKLQYAALPNNINLFSIKLQVQQA